jgi:transcriptional regulator with XRE-family HTH domain
MNQETFGRRLRAARERVALSQTDLARKLGMTRQALSQMETGKRRSEGVQLLASLALTLGVSTDYLVGLTEDNQH